MYELLIYFVLNMGICLVNTRLGLSSLMTRTSPLLQDHTDCYATGMDVHISMQLGEEAKLGSHR